MEEPLTQSIYDARETLEAFISAAAAKQPTPGGGSVAALVGALAASMGEMVLNYSLGKKDLSAHEQSNRAALAELTRARTLLLELMAEDQAAYEALTSAKKARDAGRIPAALLACIRIPQTVAAAAVAILDRCGKVAPGINRYLASDLAVCAELCMATARCAVYNIRVNLGDVADERERRKFEQQAARTLSSATQLIQRLMPKIWAQC